ncbi:rhomboid family intramembrane serine protease [Thermodesulfobacteriota bacterium]
MLIIPSTGKTSWTNLPTVTLLLIAINVVIFFSFQGNDYQDYIDAETYYMESNLGKIETSLYSQYLSQTDQDEKVSQLRQFSKDEETLIRAVHGEIEGDAVFLQKIKNLEGLQIQQKVYKKWQELRNEYEELQGMSVSFRYGYKPATGSLLTAFTCMFLHGSPDHLIGNMVFLWIVGSLIEAAGIRIAYLSVYIITGVVAALFFGMVFPHSGQPLVGASGAISGIMGFFTILYGMRRIKVFFHLGFYFGNARVYAIALLPFWVGKELFQHFWGGMSNVAYMAHFGGLVSGALLGLVLKRFYTHMREIEIEDQEDEVEKIQKHMQKGLQQITELDFQAGRRSMLQVLDMEPDNLKALGHLFNIDRQTPENENIHETTNRFFSLLAQDRINNDLLLERYLEYNKHVDKIQLAPELCMDIGLLLVVKGNLNEVTGILTYLLQNHPAQTGLSDLLLKTSQAFLREGVKEKALKCLNILCKKYPDAPEYKTAALLLNRIS